MNHAGGHHRNGRGINGPCCYLAQSWQELAHEASYSVSVLAKRCGVSVRTLERLFPRVVGQPPERWLKWLRMQRALEFLASGSTVHETAACLAYQDTSHFSRDFRKHHGFCPPPVAGQAGKR